MYLCRKPADRRHAAAVTHIADSGLVRRPAQSPIGIGAGGLAQLRPLAAGTREQSLAVLWAIAWEVPLDGTFQGMDEDFFPPPPLSREPESRPPSPEWMVRSDSAMVPRARAPQNRDS
jgi:hypothetical protein